MWLSALSKVAPQRAARAVADENMLLAKHQTETDMRNMERRREALERQIESVTAETRGHLQRKDNRAARMAIARRRRLNAQLGQVYEMLASLETTLDNYSSSETSVALLAAFKNSSKAIATWQRNTATYTPEDADAIRQEFDEHMQAANEVANIASQPVYAQISDAGVAELTVEDILLELDDETRPAPQVHAETAPPVAALHMHTAPKTIATIEEEEKVPLLE